MQVVRIVSPVLFKLRLGFQEMQSYLHESRESSQPVTAHFANPAFATRFCDRKNDYFCNNTVLKMLITNVMHGL